MCERLKLSETEQRAFLFVLLQHAGCSLPNLDASFAGTGGLMTKVVGLSSKVSRRWGRDVGCGGSELVATAAKGGVSGEEATVSCPVHDQYLHLVALVVSPCCPLSPLTLVYPLCS